MARCPHGIRGMAQRDLIDQIQDPRHTKPGVFAHWHWSRAGMGVFAGNGHLRPAQALTMRNHADIHAFGF